MTKWEDMFEIKNVEDTNETTWDGGEWLLYNKVTGQFQGTYRDPVYARKQARRKFRKALKRVEKILLG